jgi:hypothetical protein
MTRLAACLVLLLGVCQLGAQTIDESRSRFLSSPNARAGTCAPYRLVVGGLAGIGTLEVSSKAGSVVLTRQVAVEGRETIEVVLPVMIVPGVQLRAGEAQITPELPLRRIEPDYARPYVAVFSADPVYARGLLPSAQSTAICDYYELSEFFTDWRMFDGYDAIVILNPAELRLPEGSQRAIAEFCSLGGATLVAGSFRLGEKAVDLPAPADPEVQIHRGVSVQRFGYGAGAIYRVSADALRQSASGSDVMIDALRDHLWYGAERAPSGKPASRAAPERPPLAPPLPPADAVPGPLFWALAGGLLLVAGIVPVLFSRFTKRVWPAQLAVAAGCTGIAGLSIVQERPLPAIESCAIVYTGEGEAASMRMFVHAQAAWRDEIRVDLDSADRRMLRESAALPRWRGWVVDRPLIAPADDRGLPAELHGGMVGPLSFRDFATSAHRGDTEFSTDDAYLLDWWLDASAYRGRLAELAPVEWRQQAGSWDGARVLHRGAIRITPKRVGD